MKQICTACERNPAREGGKLCQKCLDRRLVYQRQRREAMKAAGLCVACGMVPTKPGRYYCDKCTKMRHRYRNSESAKKRYIERSLAGLCVRCGEPATHGCRCERCYEAEEAARRRKETAHVFG